MPEPDFILIISDRLMSCALSTDELYMEEKRNHHRLLCAELVEVNYQDRSGRPLRSIVNLEDISSSGLCVQSDFRIPVGSPVQVRHGQGEFIGKVRYCEFRDTSYFVGIEFEDNSHWSQAQYTPEHLIDPRKLMLEI